MDAFKGDTGIGSESIFSQAPYDNYPQSSSHTQTLGGEGAQQERYE